MFFGFWERGSAEKSEGIMWMQVKYNNRGGAVMGGERLCHR